MTNTANTPAETKAAPKAKAENPCQCSMFANADTGERLECNKTTTRQFAPGHDARLKGFLIKLGAQGVEVTRAEGGLSITGDAAKAAEGYGFAHMVASGIERAHAKAKEKAERAAARAAAKEKGTDSSDTVKAKVGRATYEGRIEGDEFVYEVKGAERRTTKHELV